MARYLTHRLEFSPDALSVASPAYTDVSDYVIAASWGGGQSQDLDQPQAGSATFLLKNRHRDFEPDYAAGRFGGNVLPMRRFRWSLIADGVTYPQGTWYAAEYAVDYPNPGSTFSTVAVRCVDGFGLLSLATLATLDPPTATSYGDVVDYDEPLYHWPLDETSGRKMGAASGTEGQYKGQVSLNQPNPVLGEAAGAVTFAAGVNANYGRALPDDVGVWHDTSQVTMEAVITNPGGGAHSIIAGPPSSGTPSFQLVINAGGNLNATVSTSGASNANAVAAIGTGSHHVCATYDGGMLRVYIDGVQAATDQNANNIVTPTTGGAVEVGGQSLLTSTVPLTVSHAALYDYALTPDRIAAHAAAATARGYPQQTAGTRIAAAATHALWSTAGIAASTITVAPAMQTGQTKLDAILDAVAAETPNGRFYFNDAGNPAYQPFEPDTTIRCVLGDQAGEVRYDAIGLVYDDQVYNQATVTRDGGLAQTVRDDASIAAYGGVRGHDESSLTLAYDADARLIAQAIVDGFSRPLYRFSSVDLNGSEQMTRTQILAREVGDTIRIKRRGEGGTANPDIVTRILGKQKSLDVNGDLRCTWTLARGFAASPVVWRIGQSGYSELGVTTVLG